MHKNHISRALLETTFKKYAKILIGAKLVYTFLVDQNWFRKRGGGARAGCAPNIYHCMLDDSSSLANELKRLDDISSMTKNTIRNAKLTNKTRQISV